MPMDKDLDPRDIKNFIRRRNKCFLITFLILFVIGVSIAIILPPIYRSEATILSEKQQVPEKALQSSKRNFFEQKVEQLTQKVLIRSKLIEIINEFNLYSDLKDRSTPADLLEILKKNIVLENLYAEIQNIYGKTANIPIGFTIAFESKNPISAQKVTNKLASLYIEEDEQSKEKRTIVTTTFFKQELNNLKNEIQQYEKRISDFKKSHIGELPEFHSANLQIIERLDRDFDRTVARIRTLEERKLNLQGQVANIEPLLPIVIDGEKFAMNPKERLKRLHLQLIGLRSALSEKHPDIKKLKREISELEAKVGKSDASIEKIKKLNELQTQLAEMQGKLGPEHPDVIRVSNEVELLSKEVDNINIEQTMIKVSESKPDNPVYINLMTQIAACEAGIRNLSKDKSNIQLQIEKYQKKIENNPIVEKEYSELRRDYENTKRKYDEIYNRLLEAKLTQRVHASERGEHLILKSSASLPEKPFKPNRLAIILISFSLAIAFGIGIAFIREGFDDSIKTSEQLSESISVPVLSCISYIVTAQEKRENRFKKFVLTIILFLFIGACLYYVDEKIIKLDDLWNMILERVKMIA